eukprot:1192398-Prorocentrum_minimum.AAC.8
MYSRRLPTFAFASTKSCLISMGPMSLYTLASSSTTSSSCEPTAKRGYRKSNERRFRVAVWDQTVTTGRKGCTRGASGGQVSLVGMGAAGRGRGIGA